MSWEQEGAHARESAIHLGCARNRLTGSSVAERWWFSGWEAGAFSRAIDTSKAWPAISPGPMASATEAQEGTGGWWLLVPSWNVISEGHGALSRSQAQASATGWCGQTKDLQPTRQ